MGVFAHVSIRSCSDCVFFAPISYLCIVSQVRHDTVLLHFHRTEKRLQARQESVHLVSVCRGKRVHFVDTLLGGWSGFHRCWGRYRFLGIDVTGNSEPIRLKAPSETRCRSVNRDSDTERATCIVRIRERRHFGGEKPQMPYLLNGQSEAFKYCGGGIYRGNWSLSTMIESANVTEKTVLT